MGSVGRRWLNLLDGVIQKSRNDDVDGVFGRDDALAGLQLEDGIRSQHSSREGRVNQRLVAQLYFLKTGGERER